MTLPPARAEAERIAAKAYLGAEPGTRLRAYMRTEKGLPVAKRDWIKCPICHEPDMEQEIDEAGYSLIFCVNHSCPSNHLATIPAPMPNSEQTAAHPSGSEQGVGLSFQQRVSPWMQECFGPKISRDVEERNDRFIEEALELTQACGYSAERAHALVDYVFGRLVGDPEQEVGGVMVTLAALCLANGLDMAEAGELELARINQPDIIAKIRAKQAAKPTGSALPIAARPLDTHQPDHVASLVDLRSAGWRVAVHNDYRAHGEDFTFWLFTRADGRWIKGEGRTDNEALSQCLAAFHGGGNVDE